LTSAVRLLDQLGIAEEYRSFAGITADWYADLAESSFRLSSPTPLFPRLELPAEDAM
jgi:methionyl-tRNA synthetase